MRDKTTFIKIDRNILEWGWYKDANTFRVFIHLLLTANIKAGKFMNVEIKRGELATSQEVIAKTLGISIKCVRTAIKHLVEGGEVAVRRHPRFSVISILRYDYYQDSGQSKGTSTGSQRAVNGQQSKNKRIKEIPSVYIPSREELRDYVQTEGLACNPDDVFDYYESIGWEVNGKPIKDWKARCRRWKTYDAPKYGSQSVEDKIAAARNISYEELYGVPGDRSV